jgi:hypothetical protein
MPSIVQFTDLNLKAMRLEERERTADPQQDLDRMRCQLQDRKRTRDRFPDAAQAQQKAVAEEEEGQTRMRVATIAALAEEIRRRRIFRGPESGGGNGAVKEDPGRTMEEGGRHSMFYIEIGVNRFSPIPRLHCKRRIAIFSSPAGIILGQGEFA